MPKLHDQLFDRIANFQALKRAARKAIRGKRKKAGAAAFQFGLERELLRLERELQTGTYKTGHYVEIQLKTPKKRLVSAAPFRDRVVQHALCAVVAPIFERGFIGNSFANQAGKGTHKAIAAYERYRDRHAHVLRCDIFRYFHAIDHAVLKRDLRRRIACARTLALMDTIIDGSNPQEPVHIHYPGDDLLAPLERRRGIPIGNLTSQFFANLYLDPLDHFCTEVLGAPYVRYVDDFALFHDDAAVLSGWLERIACFLAGANMDRRRPRRHAPALGGEAPAVHIGRRLTLHPSKTFIAPTSEPAEFLGLVLHAGGKRALDESNVTRFKGRLRGMLQAMRAGTLSPDHVQQRIDAWSAHAEHTHARGLKRAILGRVAKALRPGPDRIFARTA